MKFTAGIDYDIITEADDAMTRLAMSAGAYDLSELMSPEEFAHWLDVEDSEL